MLPKFPGKSRGALQHMVLSNQTLDIGVPINFSGARLEELCDKENLPGNFIWR
jgi:hypothetical protein